MDDKPLQERKAAELKEKYKRDVTTYRAKGKCDASKRERSRLKRKTKD